VLEALRIGVVGCGAMGRNHVRLLSGMREADLVGVFDRDDSVCKAVAAEYGAQACRSIDELAGAAEALVLAVPTVAHAAIGCPLLERGLDLLVEKPLASSLDEADRLLDASSGRTLAVGHVEFFNPAVGALLEHRSTPRFIVVERLSPFTVRSLDIDVVLDLMIHDLQILHALDPSPLLEVRAVGVAVLSQRIDLANVRLELESGCVANVTASRVSAERVRTLRAFLQDSYLSLDYQTQTLNGFRLSGVDGVAVPSEAKPKERISALDVAIETQEPLKLELERFIAACRGEAVAYVDGAEAREALARAHRILDVIREK
jgi:predicted dehydrogenase